MNWDLDQLIGYDDEPLIKKSHKNPIINGFNEEINADSERFSKKLNTTEFYLKSSEGNYNILYFKIVILKAKSSVVKLSNLK